MKCPQGPTSHPRSGSAREIYIYLSATKDLVKRYGLWKILVAIGVLIGLIFLVGAILL